jgi:hypothetical protein
MATKPSDRILDWASGGTTTDPGGAKEAAGWLVSERPPANWWNWILSSFGQWLGWSETSIDDLETAVAEIPDAIYTLKAMAIVTTGASLSLDYGFNVNSVSTPATSYVRCVLPAGLLDSETTSVGVISDNNGGTTVGGAMYSPTQFDFTARDAITGLTIDHDIRNVTVNILIFGVAP